MTSPSLSLLEVRGDKVLGIEGDSSEELRSEFAREAEGLQARAYQIGLAIGMSALSCSAATHASGSIAFRFSKSSGEKFDARGVYVRGAGYAVHSLQEATN